MLLAATRGRPGERYILGGGWNDEPYGFNDAYSEEPLRRAPTNGIRLMKAPDAAQALAAASRPLEIAQRDGRALSLGLLYAAIYARLSA